jgi:hypothetical protein
MLLMAMLVRAYFASLSRQTPIVSGSYGIVSTVTVTPRFQEVVVGVFGSPAAARVRCASMIVRP